MKSARELALHILMKIESDDVFVNIILNDELNKSELNEMDKNFVTQLVYGTNSNQIFEDYIIRKCSKVRFNKIALPILTILRMGIYQIYFLDKVPVSAVCNEAVKLAKKYGHMSSANFTNAILRNVSRTDKNVFLDEIKDKEERLSVEYSYPKWLINRFINQFGYDETLNLLEANNNLGYETIRVNRLKTTREEMLKKFSKSKPGKLSDILYVDSVREFLHSSEFKNGLITFQDEAPALVAHLLKPKEGEEILDICAAPGGKTTHIAELTNDKAKITAMELYEHRGELIRQTAKRLGVNSINIKIGDATEFAPEFENKFDKIVADVPCSGLGVIRKKPDIKLRVKEEDINELNKVQKAILKNASLYLKPGGVLLYSTCTILSEENEETVKWFLNENKDFSICTDESIIPSEWRSGINDGMLLLLPNKHNSDGFFICCLKKSK